MKRKFILSTLVATAMLVVGCANKKQTSAPNVSLEEFRTAIREGILGTQTYSANISTKYKTQSHEFANFNMFSINDDVIFDDDDTYFYNGYIRQKDQGIVDFQMLQGGSAVVPNEFYATDPDMKIHDFYPAAPSNIFNKLNRFTKLKNNKFTSSDIDAMAVIANLGLGITAMRVSNPESFTVTISKDYSTVVVNAQFIDNYQSEEPGALPDTFVQEPVNIKVTFTKIGTTSFPSIEEYVANPDYVYPTPTAWSESDLTILKSHFNDVVPPFMEGLSYAYEIKSKGAGNTYYALVVDYASGDLTTSYASALAGLDFEPVNATTYRKVINAPEIQAQHIYDVTMTFHDPDEVMDERTGEKWGFCYPNGVFEAKFMYKKNVLANVTNVLELVNYLELVDVNRFFSFDEVNSATSVTRFEDWTATANQGEAGDIYQFVAPSGYATFKVHFSYDDAVTFASEEEAYLNTCSELTRSTNTFAHTVLYGSDDTYTVFQFTLMSSFDESSYPGYIEIRVRITYDFYNDHKNDVRPEKVRINYQVLNQYDEDVTGDAINVLSQLPLKAPKGTLVNLSTVLNNGYAFVRYEPVEPAESEKTVAAQIEAGTFDAESAISSFIAPTYDFTLVIRVEELDPSIPRLESITVVDLTTEYFVGDTYSFDGKVIAHYSTGDVDVTSKAVIHDDNVNTNVEDGYDVLITFTDEYNQSASKTVRIYVREKTVVKYRIEIKPVDGITINVTYPVSEFKSEAERQVRFKVTAGTDLLKEVKVFTLSGGEQLVTYAGLQYFFDMPAEDVVITPIKECSVDQLEGSYSTYTPMTTQGYYNLYTLTFNADGTGTYSRHRHNLSPVTYTLNFTYTVSNTNKITVKLVGFVDGADNTSFEAGYRLFVSSQTVDPEVPGFENLNPTGIRNNNYKVTFSLVDSNGDIANIISFYRA